MQTKYSHTRNLASIKFGALLAGGALLALGSAVQADLKVVTNVASTMQGRDGSDQTQTRDITAYFKGKDIRLEAGPGNIMIVKGAEGKSYRLNTTAKTYFVQQLPPTSGAAPAPPPPTDGDAGDAPAAPPAPPKPTLTLTATTETQTTAGLTATDYTVDGSATMPARGGRGGGGQDDAAPTTPPKATLTGDLWLTALPAGTLPAGTSIASYLNVIVGRVGPLGNAISDKLAAKTLFPVATKTTTTTPGFGGQSRTSKVTSTVSSVATTSLDDSLFTIPSDYTAATQPFGGGNGGGGFGGGGGGRRGGGGQGGFGGGPGFGGPGGGAPGQGPGDGGTPPAPQAQ